MTEILKSAPVVSHFTQLLESQTNELKKQGVTPSMKVFLVGEHPPSMIYTRNKKRFIEKFGGDCEIIKLPESISEKDFLNKVKSVTSDDSVHGVFIQLPVPSQLQSIDIGNLIPPEKDVDGFSDKNLSALIKGSTGEDALISCTPKGVLTLLDFYKIPLERKNIVVIGRSLIVGKPMSLLGTNRNATVTICHSKTNNLKEHTRTADIIISAVGISKFLNKDYIGTNNPVVIDVGINHDEDGKLCGDIDYQDVKDLCSAITPVPGGVGPMTILSLAQNLLQAASKSL